MVWFTLEKLIKPFEFYALILCYFLQVSICFQSNQLTPRSIEIQYYQYYSDVEKLRELHEKDDIIGTDETPITLWDVFWPFIMTFYVTFLLIFLCFLSICIFCCITSVDWTTIGKPLEYLPCQGHAILSRRLERLATPGVYIRKDGTKEYYKPLENENELIIDIENRLKK